MLTITSSNIKHLHESSSNVVLKGSRGSHLSHPILPVTTRNVDAIVQVGVALPVGLRLTRKGSLHYSKDTI